MKTPRDILLARHRAAKPKLDAIRREALSHIGEGRRVAVPEVMVAGPATLLRLMWRELVWPCRRTWAGLATVWVLIFIVNCVQSDNVSSVTGKTVHSGGMVMSWQAQQRWMNELFADRSSRPEAGRPRNVAPGPRTGKSPNATV